MTNNAHGQEMEPMFSVVLREYLLFSVLLLQFLTVLCFPVFQSCALTTKRVQNEQQLKRKDPHKYPHNCFSSFAKQKYV